MKDEPMVDFTTMEKSIDVDENNVKIPCYATRPESRTEKIRDAVNCALKILEDNDWKNAAEFLYPCGSVEFTLVHLAAYCGKIDILERAVTLYANSSTTGTVLETDGKIADMFLATDKFGRSPFHYAAAQGHGSVISWLIRQIGTEYFTHLQLSLRDSSGKTPLHEATMELHSDVVKLLVEYGADVNAPDNEWTRPFLLAHCNVDRNDPDKMSRYENIIDIFAGAQADINCADPKSGFTMLHHAVFMESYEVTKKLLDHSADPRCQSLDRWAVTPLHVAAKIGSHGLLCILLKKLTKGLSRTQWPSVVDIPNKGKPSALQVAARYSNFECVRTLVDMGGNLARRDPYSTTGGTVMDSFCTLTNDLDIADFFKNLLDTKIRCVDCRSSDAPSKHTGSRMHHDHDEMNATLDYKVLAPEGEPQMAVVTAQIRSLPSAALRPILAHPLLRAYVEEKWLRVRKVFYGLEMFYAFFVLNISLCALIIEDHYTVRLSWMLIFFTCVPFCNNLLKFIAEPRLYSKRFQNWLSFVPLTISVVVAFSGLFVEPRTTSWIAPIMSIAVVLAWFRLMLFLCRLFGWGYWLTHVQIFVKCMRQLTLISVCLLAGSGIGAYIMGSKINNRGEFDFLPGKNSTVRSGPESVKSNMFLSGIAVIVLIVPLFTLYVLSNSLMHLVMYTARDVVKEDQIDRLVRNAEFLADCERMTARWIFRTCWIPKRLTKARKTINTSRVVNESVAQRSGISTELWKDIYLISIKKTEDSAAAIRLLDEKYNHRTAPMAHTL